MEMTERLGRWSALVLMVCLVAAFGTACGGSDGDATVTVTDSGAETTAEETGSAEATEEASGEGGSAVLAGLATPPGSKLLGSKESGDVVHQHYRTSSEPKAVQTVYEEELSSAGWSIESSGGGGGGWGSWGGSEYGLTAKREEDYFDLEAGGEKNSDSYFEICAGPGSRSECEELSDEENDSSSGGSGGNDDQSQSQSGGS